MDKINLALSLLGSELKAIALRKGTPAQWESPEPWDDILDFGGVMKGVLAKTQPEGKQVAMVLAHPRLSHQLLEIPAAKGATLERLLDRQAQGLKAFPGPAVWSRQPALPTKKGNAAFLHLFPKAILDSFVRGCEQAHVQLVRVVPSSAVLVGQLKSLPLEKDEVALLAAETGRTTTVVIGRKDGRVVVGRVLPSCWASAPEKVWIDLSRTIGFAEQQSGLTVGSIWLFGANAAAQIPGAQAAVKVPVRLSPVEYTPFYWAEQAAKLPVKDDGNLVSAEVRAAPLRRRMLTVTSVILLVLVLLSLLATGAVEVVRQVELRSIQEMNKLMGKLQDQKNEWQRKYGEVAKKKEWVRVVSDEKLPPMPAWFLGYLGQVVPDDMVLTDLRVQRTTNQAWAVRLAGGMQASTNPAPSNPALGFAALSNSLVTGPFHLEITNQLAGGQMGQGTLGSLRLLRSVMPMQAQASSVNPNQFTIEGIIR